MLNPDLHLNPKLFDQTVDRVPTRDGFGKGLMELGETNPNVVGLSADLTESVRMEEFAKKYPERFVEIGVAEQNMAAIAAGLAVTGKVPFIASYATFSPGKNWETLRTTAVYNQANVKIAGHHAGVMTGPDGPTHQATEDVASVRPWPGLTILVPCDAIEARKATVAAGQMDGPVYLRFTRDPSPALTTDETPFEIGKIEPYWISERPQVLILGMGYMLYYALMAAKQLEDEGVDVVVVNVSTIKPLDEKTLLELVKQAGAVVTVEDHQTAGGLGGAVAELLAQHEPLPMEFVGLRDTFAESGDVASILAKYEMDMPAVVEAVKKVLKRKNSK